MLAALGLALPACYSGLAGDALTGGGAADAGDGPDTAGDDGADDGADGANGDDDGDGDDGPAASCDTPSVAATPLRRLTRFEYDNTVRDLLGDSSRPATESFSPDELSGGYAANGVAPVSATVLDQYAAAAETLAATFVGADGQGEAGIDAWVDCPHDQGACATDFVTEFGRHAFRRPLQPVEVDDYVALYESGKAEFDATTGLRLVVEAMLMSPNFVYHVETVPQGADATDVAELSAFELASRVSYFVWASAPDTALLDAAESGALSTADGLEVQVRRMLDDDRTSDALASFTGQWLHVQDLPDRVKDNEMFPQWSLSLADAMQREIPAFADEVIRFGDGKLQTLLTASWTMGDAQLAALYGVAPPAGEWGRIELPADERAGVLTQSGFLTTNAHATEGSWVYRGKFVRENMLCQPLPAPPPGVEVNEPNDAGRLENPECASCHVMMDPIGQGLDDYDALGIYQDLGSSGEVSGVEGLGTFDSAVQLSNALADNDVVHQCFATQWFRYAARRTESPPDACAIGDIQTAFADSGQDIRELMVAVALSEAFRYRTALPAD